MRSNTARNVLLTVALAAFTAASAHASAVTIAYATQLEFGGIDYMRLDLDGHYQYIGAIGFTPAAAAFAGDDYSKQYVTHVTLPILFSFDVQTSHLHLVGTMDIGERQATGMHWDPTSSQMYLIAQDTPCTTTTLYVVSTADAATLEVGSTPRCMRGLAIDADGNAFSLDEDGSRLVSLDTATGAAATIGPLGINVGGLIGGLDFDPLTGELNLFALAAGRYLVDTAQGTATHAATYDFAPLAVSLAVQPDEILADGFDP